MFVGTDIMIKFDDGTLQVVMSAFEPYQTLYWKVKFSS